MKSPQNNSWPRLAGACADARDDLRSLIPELDAAIRAADTWVLLRVRALAVRHAEALKAALKAATGKRQARRNADSARFQPLWATVEGSPKKVRAG